MPKWKAARRDCSIRFGVEPILYGLMEKASFNDDLSISSYCRMAVIKDLKARGLLTEDMLTDLL